MLILVLGGVLLMMGTVAMRVTTNDIRASGNYKHSVEALYLAEAGIARAKLALDGKDFGTVLGEIGVDTSNLAEFDKRMQDWSRTKDRDTSLQVFLDTTEFGEGEYSVMLFDNNDGDGDPLTDSDGRLMARSTGVLVNGSNRTLEVVFAVSSARGMVGEGAIVAAGDVRTLGTLVVDGRDHDINGNYVGSGMKGINTLGAYSRGGNSKVGGTDDFGTDKVPSKSIASVVEENATGWSEPDNPDDALGLDDGTLEALARSGVNGSQYVENPSDLSTPLNGVTYVKLKCGETWTSVHLGNSQGILVVHSDCKDATIKNINTGTFKGILIADDIVHIHNDIIGMVLQISSAPSSGNCIGNGNGSVKYSSQAIGNALASITNVVRIVAWREI